MRRIFLILVFLFCFAEVSQAADSVVASDTENVLTFKQATIASREITFTCETDDGTIAVATGAGSFVKAVNGYLVGYTYIVDGTGDPDTGMDVVVYAGDADGSNKYTVLSITDIGTASVTVGPSAMDDMPKLQDKTLFISASSVGSGTRNFIFRVQLEVR